MNEMLRDSNLSLRRPKKKRTSSRTKISPLRRFSVAIVEPEFGINLGYLARTSANFGIEKLHVISKKSLSKDTLSKALLFSSHGRGLIEDIEFLPSLESLKRRYSVLIGTTAIEARRKSNLTRRNLAPEECAERVFERVVESESLACFVFGRDTTGLTNEELRQCDFNLTIRTYSSYNTLNISHAAAVILYVFGNLGRKYVKEHSSNNGKGNPAPSTRKERERAVSLFLQLARDSDFQLFKEDLLRESLERIFNRSDPSLREIYLLTGLASKAAGKIHRLSTRAS